MRRKRVATSVDPDVYDSIKEAAYASNRTISTLLRILITDAIKKTRTKIKLHYKKGDVIKESENSVNAHLAFEDWLKSEHGLKSNDYSTLTGQQYLRNRLYWAFMAGAELNNKAE